MPRLTNLFKSCFLWILFLNNSDFYFLIESYENILDYMLFEYTHPLLSLEHT